MDDAISLDNVQSIIKGKDHQSFFNVSYFSGEFVHLSCYCNQTWDVFFILKKSKTGQEELLPVRSDTFQKIYNLALEQEKNKQELAHHLLEAALK